MWPDRRVQVDRDLVVAVVHGRHPVGLEHEDDGMDGAHGS
jgi:hypothetical protein